MIYLLQSNGLVLYGLKHGLYRVSSRNHIYSLIAKCLNTSKNTIYS